VTPYDLFWSGFIIGMIVAYAMVYFNNRRS
jgi:hypothetical protein